MPIFKKVVSIVDQVDTATGFDLAIDKAYLLLLVQSGDEDITQGEFVALRGRKDTYEYIKTNCLNGNYNILKSHILSGGITFGNEVSLYTFARLCIQQYQYDDISELEYLNDQAINTSLNPDSVSEGQLESFFRQELSAKAK